VDYFYLTILALLMGVGVLLVYSATADEASNWLKSFWFRQIIFFGVGTALATIIANVHPRFFKAIAYPAYILSLLALFYVALGGGSHSSHGAGRWISIASFRLQPSEFAKIAYLLALSRMLSGRKLSLKNLRAFILPGILFGVPFILILKQPDLSTALVFMVMTLVGFYWAGMRVSEIFLLISPGLSVIATTNNFVWAVVIVMVLITAIRLRLNLRLLLLVFIVNLSTGYASFMIWNSVLKDHQRSRILTFLDPLRDPKGAGYQVIQSKVAVGSGGITGKGFGQGSQTNLSFLPEEHTDFIFSVLGEQFGLLGCATVIFLYFLLIMRGIHIVTLHGNRFSNFLVVGANSIFVFHIFVNIAMTLGMMPVTGLPLPFLSYGGSFVITCMILVGLLMNMRIHSHRI
jgi:rod shape determining protein RodA